MFPVCRLLLAIVRSPSPVGYTRHSIANRAHPTSDYTPHHPHRVHVAAIVAVCVLSAGPAWSEELNSRPHTLTVINRRITQEQGTWVIDYRFRHNTPHGVVILPEEIAAKVEGWVSNSRVASHAIPRWSSLTILHGPELIAVAEIISATDEGHRCRERLAMSVWSEDRNTSNQESPSPPGPNSPTMRLTTAADQALPVPLSLAPQSVVHVRLQLEHQHILYGDYDPLLSTRAVELTIGSSTVHDLVPLDREQYVALPRFQWPEPPDNRRDTRHVVSGPDSLHIEAHVPGHQYYRYPERPVRYSTKMRLQFWYLIAVGTEGECRVAIAQYKDTPTSWRKLNNGGFEQSLKTIGHWTKVDHILQTEAEATTLTLEFKIVGDTEIGEMWIDDVSLEPVGCSLPSGP